MDETAYQKELKYKIVNWKINLKKLPGMNKDSKRNFKKEKNEVNHHSEQRKLNYYLDGNVQP